MDAGEMNLFLEQLSALTSSAATDSAVAVQTASLCPRCSTLLDEHMVSGEGAFTCWERRKKVIKLRAPMRLGCLSGAILTGLL
ncbi:MAG: hypothetical protein M3Z35_06540 [Nitrospirota bacterium]|nr:hypothetical protein [Nitrospirota bacterium]